MVTHDILNWLWSSTRTVKDVVKSPWSILDWWTCPNSPFSPFWKSEVLHYLIGTTYSGIWYPHSFHFDLLFRCWVCRWQKWLKKSTGGTCQILGQSLIFRHIKKQTSVSLSTIELEYLVVGSCGAQLLWMMHQLLDYDLSYKSVRFLW